jgi:hypothetical protein
MNIRFFLLILLFLGVQGPLFSQSFLKKVTKQVEDKVNKKISGDETRENTSGNTQENNSQSTGSTVNSSTGSKKIQNTKGGGLISTPPDVNQNIAEARTAFADKKFSQARYAVRQALQGIELEIGQAVLHSLPEKADEMPAVVDEDKVMSGGIGFAGLMIHRVYRGDEKELSVEIVNDAAMFSGVSMVLTNPTYQMAGNEQAFKQIKYKGYPAVIKYEESSGYTLSVPFGQTSLFVVNGVNYSDETTFTATAGIFDIDKIKSELGEK